jgi:acyl-CoA hydrolase
MTIKTEVANHPQKGKRLVESKSEITIMMLPSDANPRGNVYAGEMITQLHWKRTSPR